MILSSLTVLLTFTVLPSLSTTCTVYDGLTYPPPPLPLPPEDDPPLVEVLTGTVILPFESVAFSAVLLSLSDTLTVKSLTGLASLSRTVTVVWFDVVNSFVSGSFILSLPSSTLTKAFFILAFVSSTIMVYSFTLALPFSSVYASESGGTIALPSVFVVSVLSPPLLSLTFTDMPETGLLSAFVTDTVVLSE